MIVLIILSGLLISFSMEMRVEAIASANRVASAQADCIEQGAEMWILAQVEAHRGDAMTVTQTPAEALEVGKGYFWILRPDPHQFQLYSFGISDESAKLNLNSASAEQLMLLPGLNDQTLADSIVAWTGPRSDDEDSDSPPVHSSSQKNAPFETVEELLLVTNFTPRLLYGADLNRNGVLETVESTAMNSFGDDRGIANYVTCNTAEPNQAIDGTGRINVNDPNTTRLEQTLDQHLTNGQGSSVIEHILPILQAGGFPTLAEFYFASGLSASDFASVCDYLSAHPSPSSLTGLIDINTASAQVLMCLPGISQADADSLVGARASNGGSGGIGWVFDALGPDRSHGIANYITSRSFQYSADIVAVSGDGRAYSRERIVVDARRVPARIVYRKNLNALGWPLDPQIRDSMRHGQPFK